MLTKCVFFKPDFVLLYASINDAYLQPHKFFKDDYSHIRKIPSFPKFNIYTYIPHFKYLYLSYYIHFLIKYLAPKRSLLFFTTLNKREYEADYSNIKYILSVFKSYIKSFDGICLRNNITPIYVPWQFNNDLVNNPFGYSNFSNWDKSKFINLLDNNNKNILDISTNNNESIYLNLPKMEKDCYNYILKNDWMHMTSKGLHQMSENIYIELIKNENFLKKISKK